jgi:hypothetical protein
LSKSKFIRKNYIWLIFVLGILLIGFIFLQKPFTGRVVQEICNETEVCENVTVVECEEDCQEVCLNETEEVCSTEVVEICEEECYEEGNETICEDVCVEEEVENCTEVVIENCSIICEEVNCTEGFIENCSVQEICYEIEINQSEDINDSEINETLEEEIVSEPTPEKIFEEEVAEKIAGQEETFRSSVSNLTEAEKFNLISKTGTDEILVTRSDIIGEKIVLKFEIGNYWVEKVYYYPQENLNEKIEEDKIKWLRKISNINNQKIKTVKEEEFLD